MTVTKVSNLIIEYSIKQYADTENRLITVHNFMTDNPEVSINLVSDALELLKSDNLVNNFYASGVPYMFELNVRVLRDKETVSSLSKFYTILKELRDWIPGY